ncbi:hypothetical protein [Parasphingorhabdus cellanae]|uniref:Uncharacterized protein n=1 Tax=Parasphingorhabdus cellanae TaxID=2806553 RepID=A0ABX7T6G8_9SPHN|nr:hypothetical protein [Parasphingorhabdus cellanae]QTD57188.1 hypothetical protein J4G78_06490 [Parasphingorhabdus cellanae]
MTAETNDENAALVGPYQGSMSHNAYDTPKRIAFFEITLAIENRKLSPKIIQTGCVDIEDGKSFKSYVKKAMTTGLFPNSNNQPTQQTGRGRPGNPNGFSLNCKTLDYIIIKLSEADFDNWRFPKTLPPFSSGDEKFQKAEGRKGFPPMCAIMAEARLLQMVGSKLKIAHPTSQNPATCDSKWAYFVFDGELAHKYEPKFAVRYNIHLELIDPITGNGVPLIIDPDVGFPDGTEPLVPPLA